MSDIVANYDVRDFFNLGLDLGGLISEITIGSTEDPNINHEHIHHPNVTYHHSALVDELYKE